MTRKTTLSFLVTFFKMSKNALENFKKIRFPITVILACMMLINFGNSQAQNVNVTIPSGGFEIDANLVSNSPSSLTNPTSPAGDWVQGVSGPGGHVLNNDGTPVDPTTTGFFRDEFNSSFDNTFSQGKASDNPTTWNWTASAANPSKGDIHNAMYHIAKDGVNNQWIFIASDRLTTTGTSYIDFEFFQNAITTNSSGRFDTAGPNGGRTVNDILLTMEYGNGGSVATVFFYLWKNTGSKFEWVLQTTTGTNAFAQTNTGAIDVPFSAFGYLNYNSWQFVEGAINLTSVFGTTGNPCLGVNIKTLLVKTKNSTAPSASLNDFIGPLPVEINFGTATISYENPVCSNSAPVLVTQTGVSGGTYSALPIGLNINSSTGAIDIINSTVGAYTVTYSFTNNGCTKSATTGFTISDLPNTPTVNAQGEGDQSECRESPIQTLTAKASVPQGYSIIWYDQANDGSPVTPTWNTVGSKTYYAEAVNNTTNCKSNTRTSVKLEILAAPDAPTVNGEGEGDQSECRESPIQTLTAKASAPQGYSIVWYNQATDGSPVTPTWNTVGSKTYYAEAVNNITNCKSNTRTSVKLEILPEITLTAEPNTVTCNGEQDGEINITKSANSTVTIYNSDNENVTLDNGVLPAGIYTVVASESNGETDASCKKELVVNILVRDNDAPTISVPETLDLEICKPSDITALNARFALDIDGSEDIKDSFETSGYTADDDQEIESITYTDVINETDCLPTVTRTFYVTDNCGGQSSDSIIINLFDNTDPEFNETLPEAELTVECDNVPTAVTLTAKDNCSGELEVTYTETFEGKDDECATEYIIRRKWSAIDCSDNDIEFTQVITVQDTKKPEFNETLPKAELTVECDNIPNALTLTATDNCSGSVDVTFEESISNRDSDSDFEYTITRTWMTSDCAGNVTSFVQVINIEDNSAPILTEQGEITLNNDPGLCGAIVNYSVPTATNNCGTAEVTLTEGFNSGEVFPVGETTVTYTATDAAGNTSDVSFTVTVIDNEKPTIECPTNISEVTENGEQFAVVNYIAPVGTDNCPGAITEQTAGLASGSNFPLGTTTNTFVVTDAAGNTATCSFDVIVTDIEPPTITCPSDIDQNVDQGVCGAVVTYELPTATDNDGQLVTVTIYEGSLASGSVFPVGTTTVSFTATDAAGNLASCSFDVTVNDTEDPTFGSVSNINVNTDAGVCGAVVSFEAPEATDNCEGTLVTLNEGSMDSGSEFPVGTTTMTYTATDAAGNTSTLSFDVIVTDNEAPAITCPADVNQTTETGESYAIVNFENATATDNCDVTVAQTAGLTSGSQFPIGESTVTFTATDASGNTTECSFTITVTDEEPPTIVCPANINMDVDQGICGAVVSFQTPTSTDNSDLAVTVTQTAGPASGEVFPVGTTIVTFTATDAAGNSVSCSFDVTVNDTEDPTFGSVSDINVNTDAGVCGAVVSFEAPAAKDNCEGTVVTLNEGSMASGSEFPVGTTTVTYTATDAAGNTATLSFDVIVTDNEAPVITCPADIIQTTETGESYAIVNFENATATDNCDVTVAQTAGLTSGSQFPIGESTVTFTATDASGNTTECSFTVTVTEDQPNPPIIAEVVQPTCEIPTGTITVETIEGLTYSVNGVDYQVSGEFPDLEPGTYSVTAQTAGGLTSEVTSVTLNEPVAVIIEPRTDVSQCYDGGSYDLFNLLIGEFDRTGTWEDPNSTGALDGSILNLSSFENDLGTYIFNYVLSGNCPSTTAVELTIDDSCIVLDCSIDDIKKSISKAVTPNGDGFNDFFTIGVDLDCGFTFDVKIFNRWGAEIYSMRNYQNNWDGFSDKSFTSSNQLPSGTYYYIIEINGASGLGPIQGYIYLGTK